MITTFSRWARGGRVFWIVCLLAGLTVLLSMGLSGHAIAQDATDSAATTTEVAPADTAPADTAPADVAPAEEAAPEMTFDKGDNAWMMISSVLVLLMTVPGLALFYGGLVRTKNMASMLTQILSVVCIVCVVWFLYGYSMAFNGGGIEPFIGGFTRVFLSGINADSLAATFSDGVGISELTFVCFQMTFAAITTALAVGSFAERMKFSTIFLFAILWSTFVYFPIAHMVWYGDGLMFQMGALDFAGGMVVHLNSGIAGLVGALLLGRRIGYKQEPMPPHSVTLTMVGAALLWVGWFGFNAGSNLEANGVAGLALANTFVATAAAGLSWMLVEWAFKGKPSLLGLCSGVVAGLVAVTPASGIAGPMGALALGAAVGPLCLFFCSLFKNVLGYDDALDVFGIHGIGGAFGALATGILVSPALGGVGVDGYNMASQVIIQAKSVAITAAWSGIGSLLIFMALSLTFGLRVSQEAEREGLDITEHGEQAYNY